MFIKGNYENVASLKSALGIPSTEKLGFYDNDKSYQCWVTVPTTQVCITVPKDIDPSKPIVVQSTIRPFTIESKVGLSFMALWVFNGTEEKNKEVMLEM